MMCTRSVFLLGFATAVVTCSGAFRQMRADDQWPDRTSPWARPGGPPPVHHRLEDELDRAFSLPNTDRQLPSGSGPATITLYELAHKVPGKAMKEYERATKAQEKGDHESAIEHLKKTVAIDPEFSVALNNLGVNYLFTNRVDLAIEQFNKVIAIDPHAATPYRHLAVAYLMQNQYADAERAARQGVNHDRGGTRSGLVLGFSLVMQNKFTPEAEQTLRKAAVDFPQASLLLAPELATKGEIGPAKDHLQRYLDSGDKSAVDLAKDWMQRLDSTSQTKQ